MPVWLLTRVPSVSTLRTCFQQCSHPPPPSEVRGLGLGQLPANIVTRRYLTISELFSPFCLSSLFQITNGMWNLFLFAPWRSSNRDSARRRSSSTGSFYDIPYVHAPPPSPPSDGNFPSGNHRPIHYHDDWGWQKDQKSTFEISNLDK